MESNIEEIVSRLLLSCLSGIFRDKTVGMVVHPQLTLGDMAEESGLDPVVEHKVDEISFLIVVYGDDSHVLRIAVEKLLVSEVGVTSNIEAKGLVPAALDQRMKDTLSGYAVEGGDKARIDARIQVIHCLRGRYKIQRIALLYKTAVCLFHVLSGFGSKLT